MFCAGGERRTVVSCSISRIQRASETSKETLLELLMNYGNYDLTERTEIKWVILTTKKKRKN